MNKPTKVTAIAGARFDQEDAEAGAEVTLRKLFVGVPHQWTPVGKLQRSDGVDGLAKGQGES